MAFGGEVDHGVWLNVLEGAGHGRRVGYVGLEEAVGRSGRY